MSKIKRQLQDSKAFDAVFRDNRYRVSSKSFLFLAIENHLGYSRLGMVIGKKNIKLATQRSRTKRSIRENFRQHFLDFSPSIDLVVVARNGVETRDKPHLNQQVQELMEKLTVKISRVDPKCS